MKFYIIYYDHISYDTLVRTFDYACQACGFVKEMIESKSLSWSYKLNDFTMIHGEPVDIVEYVTYTTEWGGTL